MAGKVNGHPPLEQINMQMAVSLPFPLLKKQRKAWHKGSIWEVGHWDCDVEMFHLAIPNESLAN